MKTLKTLDKAHLADAAPEQHWNDNRVAAYLGVSVATVRRWRPLGEGPAWRRIGSSIKYFSPDVIAWAAAQRGGGETASTATGSE